MKSTARKKCHNLAISMPVNEDLRQCAKDGLCRIKLIFSTSALRKFQHQCSRHTCAGSVDFNDPSCVAKCKRYASWECWCTQGGQRVAGSSLPNSYAEHCIAHISGSILSLPPGAIDPHGSLESESTPFKRPLIFFEQNLNIDRQLLFVALCASDMFVGFVDVSLCFTSLALLC